MTSTKITDEARELADRCYSAMAQTVTGNGDWAAALAVGREIIQQALTRRDDEIAELKHQIKVVQNALSSDTVNYSKITRVEIIDNNGRSYINTNAAGVDISIQDDGRTLKIFTLGYSL